MNKTTVKFKKLDERAQMPHYGTEFAAGADLYACLDAPLTIAKGATEFVHTGIAMEIPTGLVGLVYARSGLACKKGLAPRGLDFLHEVCSSVKIPVYSIGRIHEENMESCIQSGAAGVCMMSEYMKI